MISRPLPKSIGRLKGRTTAFCGLDRRPGAPFGALRDGEGFICEDGITLRGGKSWRQVYSFPPSIKPMSMAAIGGALFSVCRTLEFIGSEYVGTEDLQVVAYTEDGNSYISEPITIVYDPESGGVPSSHYDGHRSMVQFNVYSEDGALSDALGGSYDKKLLIFPDKLSVDLPVRANGFSVSTMDGIRDAVPDLKCVTVSGGRLFGVDDGRIYAGAYNDPWNWDVDTPDDIGAENAWVTATGADVRGDGAFTAIAAHDGRVFCMKEDFGHLVSGGSNPFSVKDTDAIGAVGADAAVSGDGRLYFVRSDGIRMAQNSSVGVISDPLCLPQFTEGICAYHDGVLYVAEGERLYLYHYKSDSWSVLPLPEEGKVLSLAAGDMGLYALVHKENSENYIYLLNGDTKRWSFSLAATDLSVDTDKGPATLTLHGDAEKGSVITVELLEECTGKTVPLGSVTGDGGRVRFRRHIRGGAGHSFVIKVSVKGQAVVRGITVTARSGVRDDG